MANKLSEVEIEGPRKRVYELLRTAETWAAGCTGFTREDCDDMARRLREEARRLAEDFNVYEHPVCKELERYTEIANIDPAKLAFSERQRTLGKRDRPKPWHKPAIAVIEELHSKAAKSWTVYRLAKELDKRRAEFPPGMPETLSALENFVKKNASWITK